MILKKIYIENFMSHRKTEIDCTQFNSCLIVGKSTKNDRESNGTGKSTIFKAINFVLFGEYPTKKIDLIVRDGQDKCVVEVDFEIDGIDYRATRKRSVASGNSEFLLKNKVGDKWILPDGRTKSATENQLKELIKINFDAFKNSVLFEQNSLSEIAEGTDTQRRKILKEPLNLNIYTQLEKLAKKRYTVQEKDLDKKKTLIENIGDPDSDIILLTKELKDLHSSISLLEKERKAIKYDLVELRNKLSEKEKLLSSDGARVAEKLVEIDSQKSKINIQIESINKKIINYNNELKQKNKELEDKKNILIEKENHLKEIKEKTVRTEQEVTLDISNLDKKEQKGIKYVASLEVKYDRLSKPLPEGAQCEECFNELTDEYRHRVLHDNSEKSKNVKDELELAKSKMLKLKNKRKAFYDEIKEISKILALINSLNDQIKNLKSNIKSSKDYIFNIEKLSKESLDNLKDLNNKIKLLEEEEKDLSNMSKDFSVSKINNSIISIQSSIREKELEESNIIKEISHKSTMVGISEEKKRSREEDSKKLVELIEQRDSLERNVKIHSRVVRAFSSSGIPTLIIHTILDDLQVEANNILQEIRPEISICFSIEKDDKDVLDISYLINGRERDYAQLSGGQKTFIAFSLKLGLSLVIQKRLNVTINFLQLDEVDQPLDQSGQDAYVDIIRKYQDRFKIFVVTHNDRLKDKFNHAILVENDGDNGSTGKLVTSW